VPHQFANTLAMCRELAALGYRRIGLVLPVEHDITVHHGFSAAVAWQGLLGGTELVRPLAHESPLEPEELRRWFRRERPDSIIAPGGAHCRAIAALLGLSIPGRIGFAVGDRLEPTSIAGMDERPREIGTAAMDLLHSKLISGNLGVPSIPTVAMVMGRWAVAESVPGPAVARRRKTGSVNG
jgi:DNA-binding LacI/PurR family transcriptional regulator